MGREKGCEGQRINNELFINYQKKDQNISPECPRFILLEDKTKILDFQKSVHTSIRVRTSRVLLQSSYIANESGFQWSVVTVLFPWHLTLHTVWGRIPQMLDTSLWWLQPLHFLLIRNHPRAESTHCTVLTMQRFPRMECKPGRYLIDGELFPSRLQVPWCGLAELFVAVIFLTAIVIHQCWRFGPAICSSWNKRQNSCLCNHSYTSIYSKNKQCERNLFGVASVTMNITVTMKA